LPQSILPGIPDDICADDACATARLVDIANTAPRVIKTNGFMIISKHGRGLAIGRSTYV